MIKVFIINKPNNQSLDIFNNKYCRIFFERLLIFNKLAFNTKLSESNDCKYVMLFNMVKSILALY
jgi:hypothetical protein